VSFVKFAVVDEIPSGGNKSLRLGLRRIAVFNLDGNFHAIEDACAHMKVPLSQGRVRGIELTCSMHGWVFDITTGRRKGVENICVRTFPVKIDGENVFVDPEVPDEFAADPDDLEGAEDEFPAIS
jgi:nitrite reductase/ring-hydroxylating ferredoxin subunit